MAFQSVMKMELTVTEPIALGVDLAAAPTVTHNGLNTATAGVTRTTIGTIRAQKVASKRSRALVGGADTLNLTTLAGIAGATVDMTGQRVNQILLACPPTNSASMTFQTGAANGYALDGTAWKWTLGPGESRLVDKAGNAPLVSATAKTIDIAGAGTDVYSYEIVSG